MGVWRRALLRAAGLAFLAGVGAASARAQAPEEAPRPEEPALSLEDRETAERMRRRLSEARRFENICQRVADALPDLDPAGRRRPVADDLLRGHATHGGFLFFAAVRVFCDSGNFILDNRRDDGTCGRRLDLDASQIEIVRSLATIERRGAASPIRRIELYCVGAAGTFDLTQIEADHIRIQDASFRQLWLHELNVRGGLSLRRVVSAGAAVFRNNRLGSFVDIVDCAFGEETRGAEQGLTVRNLRADALHIESTRLRTLNAVALQLSVGLGLVRLDMRGGVTISSSDLGTFLEVTDGEIGKDAALQPGDRWFLLRNSVVSRRVEIDGTRFGGGVELRNNKVAGRTILRRVRLDTTLSLFDNEFGIELDVTPAEIGGRAAIESNSVAGGIALGAADKDAIAYKARLSLLGNRVGTDINASRIKSADEVSIQSNIVAGRIRIADLSAAGGLRVNNNTVGSEFALIGFAGEKTATVANNGVAGGFFVEGGDFGGGLSIARNRVGPQLALTNVRARQPTYVNYNAVTGGLRIGGGHFERVPGRGIYNALEIIGNVVGTELGIEGTKPAADGKCGAEAGGGRTDLQAMVRIVGDLNLFASEARVVRIENCVHVEGDLLATSLQARERLFLRSGIVVSVGDKKDTGSFGDIQLARIRANGVDISEATVGRRITAAGAEVAHAVLQKISVGESIFLGNSRFRALTVRQSEATRFDCSDCLVEQYLNFTSRTVESANLAGAEVRGPLLLREGDEGARWGKSATLDFSGARFDTISADLCDLMADIPPTRDCRTVDARTPLIRVDLNGARYRAIVPGRRGARDKQMELSLLDLPQARLLDLLRGGEAGGARRFDPQPYEQLADALTAAGDSKKAEDIKVAKIDARLAHERATSTDFDPGLRLEHSWYALGRFFTEYGNSNERALLAYIGWVLVGMLVHLQFSRSETAEQRRLREAGSLTRLAVYSGFFSLDRSLPALSLDRSMEEMSHYPTWLRIYFYAHRVVGTILISLFVSGVAGLFD